MIEAECNIKHTTIYRIVNEYLSKCDNTGFYPDLGPENYKAGAPAAANKSSRMEYLLAAPMAI